MTTLSLVPGGYSTWTLTRRDLRERELPDGRVPARTDAVRGPATDRCRHRFDGEPPRCHDEEREERLAIRIRPPSNPPSSADHSTGSLGKTDTSDGRSSSRSRTADTVDTADVDGIGERDDETDTSFTSLENHLFGARYFEDYEVVDEQGRDQTTMLHKSASASDTVVQRSLDTPPPVQVIQVLPPGSRPTDAAALRTPAPARGSGQMAAAGGVFAGVSMVAAGSLVALGLVCSVAIYLLIRSPSAPGTVAEAPPPEPVGQEDIDRAAQERVAEPPAAPAPGAGPVDPALAELREGIRFPADFAFNDWRPQGLDEAALAELVTKLEGCSERIRVTGHTDQKGTDLTNDTFALARAGEVRRILGQKGIDKRRIEVTSAGSADPEADAGTVEGRAFNRRVVVRCY